MSFCDFREEWFDLQIFPTDKNLDRTAKQL